MGKRLVAADGTVTIEGKRGNGESSIYQRGDGVWCAALRQADGKRRVLYGRSREDVARKLKEAEASVVKGGVIPDRRETLAHFLDRWLADVVPQRARPKTALDYATIVRLYIAPALGRLKLADVTPQRVQPFLNGLAAKGLSRASVVKVRAVLRSALAHAEREGLIGRNAAALAITPMPQRKPVTALTPDNARRLLDAFAGHPLEGLVVVSLATGLRQGEALGLRWEDIDLDTAALRVRFQLQRIDRAYRLTEPKTDRSRRTLTLPPIAIEALRRERVKQAESRLLAGPLWADALGLVFTTAEGHPWNAATVTHAFRRAIVAAGLPAMTWHELRHGAATLLVAQGVPLRVVMEQLGHSQIALTANLYSHVAPALLQDAAHRLQQALGGA